MTATPEDDGPFDFADVDGSARAPMHFTLDLSIAGLDDDDDANRDTASAAPWWGTWPVFARPAAPTAAGRAQALILRRGDEPIVLAIGDARWVLDLDEGDAVFTAAASGVRVVLRANGKAAIVSDDVRLSSEDVTDFVALASKVNDRLATIRTAFNTHQHVETGTTTNTPGTPITALDSVAAEKVRAA